MEDPHLPTEVLDFVMPTSRQKKDLAFRLGVLHLVAKQIPHDPVFLATCDHAVPHIHRVLVTLCVVWGIIFVWVIENPNVRVFLGLDEWTEKKLVHIMH